MAAGVAATTCGGGAALAPSPSAGPVASSAPPGATTAPPAGSVRAAWAAPAAPSKTTETATATPAARADPSLLARKVLFGNPDRAAPHVSHNGKRLAWLAPKDGVMNVYVGTGPMSDITKAKPVTDEKRRPILAFSWAFDDKHVLYATDQNGDENTHVYSVDVATSQVKDLTPLEKISARIQFVSEKFPTVAVLAINDRDPKYHDLYRVDIVSGKRTLLQKNESFSGFVVDEALKVRYATRRPPGGGLDLLVADGKGGFAPFQSIPQADDLTTGPIAFDKAGRTFFMRESRDRDTGALVALDTRTATAAAKVLAEDARADVAGILTSPADGHAQAALFYFDRQNWKVLDKAIEPDLEYLKTVVDGDVEVVSRSRDDKRWTVAYVVSDGPVRYYLYDRPKRAATFLFTNRPSLEGAKLARMHPVLIPTRDGKTLVSYLSLPPPADAAGTGKPSAPLPMVLLVHGGPWGRDVWGLNGYHQWVASRGYAALSVNFRGSTGFGKSFVNAGDKEWAGKMHDDLLDAVDWAVKAGVADRARVAIMGGSYGGYATLVGLTYTPEVFACGVDIFGPANLNTLLAAIPPYWKPIFENLARRVGDPRTDEGKKLLDDRSPLGRAAAIRRPLLIGQGANDVRVKQAESDSIVNAMKARGLPVSYLLFPDEGHGFRRPENNIAFLAVAEAFLAQHLGGTYQPIGDDFEGASIQVPEGAAHVLGLAEALPKKEP
jgi:dipeptidyl aminopeptidase/acylaminoacyl peptidase